VGTKTMVPAVPGGATPRRKPQRLGSAAVIAVANCALAGVTTVFVTTRSVQVTLIAAAAAVLLAAVATLRS
jgi:hypothetical protein